MLKLTLRPGEFIDIGKNIRVVFSGGSAHNIHLLVDAPKELNIARSSAAGQKAASPYYSEGGISEEAKREIREILRREKKQASAQKERTSGQVSAQKERASGQASAPEQKNGIYVVRHS